MKKITLLLSLLLVTASVNTASAKNHTPAAYSAVKSVKKIKYRVSVSFISIGAGIDNESYEKIESFLKSHPKKPAFEVIQKGREGERTIYMKLGELSAAERKTFVEELNKLIVKKELVKVEENDKVKKIKS